MGREKRKKEKRIAHALRFLPCRPSCNEFVLISPFLFVCLFSLPLLRVSAVSLTSLRCLSLTPSSFECGSKAQALIRMETTSPPLPILPSSRRNRKGVQVICNCSAFSARKRKGKGRNNGDKT